MESHGALVGWTHHDLGNRVMLKMESYHSAEDVDRVKPDQFRFLMTKQQAAVLGNYLMEISGESSARGKERGWFRRLFG
ncbi:hypothetical protein P7228_10790 [Altererythrobacter arenosus]|uniref:Uncharacterized protein n=1 Tax=Altererythrobacter arenosus TaxID=3032592 RepID=A0ABY8FN84_9SPHN|nr:hypothetical protein [Altererythrobacter sp. CAU 1644]WFL76482.1 hypothetical protein P7228_10790 [Altererythrobacter sp. CAU 1644]